MAVGVDRRRWMEQLINQSENQRQGGSEWIRIWMNDMPSHLTPERIHGGLNPKGEDRQPVGQAMEEKARVSAATRRKA
jgi:hypothetical protein